MTEGRTSLAGNRVLWVVVALFAASLLVRGAYLVASTGVDAPLSGDEPDYHGIAASFLRGDGWTDPAGNLSYRPPLLPFQLMLLYGVAGPDPVAARWAMVAVSSLIAPLLYLEARSLVHRRDGIALLGAAAWVLYPPAIWYAGRVVTENMAAILVLGGLGAYLWAARSGSAWAAAFTGTLWALAALNQPTLLLLPLALVSAQVVLGRLGRIDWSWPHLRWGLALACFALVMTPWTVRNYVEHGVIMPTTSGLGWLMLMSNGTLQHQTVQAGGYFKNPELVRARAEGNSEAARDAIGRRLALDELRENWRLLPRPLVNRAINFWTPRPDPFDSSWTRNDWIMLAVWGPALVLFATSSFLRSWRQNWPALTVVVYAFVFVLPFWGTPRFRFPVDPIIIIGASVGLTELLGGLSSVRQRLSAVATWRAGLRRTRSQGTTGPCR